jgi:hypothetical protein
MGAFFGTVFVEVPKYEVARSFDWGDYKYEIRRYQARIVAEVRSDTLGVSSSHFADEAFRALAQYIGLYGLPTNRRRESVAMTAPVQTRHLEWERIVMTAPVITTKQAAGGSDRSEQEKIAAPILTPGSEYQTRAILLPSKYTMDTVPEPTDARVKLKEIPPRYEAVHRYSGLSNVTTCGPKVEQLYEHLRLDGVKVLEGGSWHFEQYNQPITIPRFRRNEIHIPVEFNSEY